MSYSYVELFSGPGGLSLGAVLTGKITPVFALDIDPDSCESYQRNIGSHVTCADIHTFNLEKIPAHDILGFGFPCNDYSLVGEQRGLMGKYGPLYSYAVKVLKSHQPMAFVAENVDGLTGNNGGIALNQILNDMHEAGYDLFLLLNLREKWLQREKRLNFLRFRRMPQTMNLLVSLKGLLNA